MLIYIHIIPGFESLLGHKLAVLLLLLKLALSKAGITLTFIEQNTINIFDNNSGLFGITRQ
jgi:hypothetical protein